MEHGCSTADRNRALLARRDASFLQRSDVLHGFAKVHALQSTVLPEERHANPENDYNGAAYGRHSTS
jgi:hypothetical protein